MMIIAQNFRRFDPPRNTLRAFFDAQLPSGLLLHDCGLHEKGGTRWPSLPGKPQLDKDGRVLLSPKTGKRAFSASVSIPDREIRERFNTMVLEAIDRLLAGDGAP